MTLLATMEVQNKQPHPPFSPPFVFLRHCFCRNLKSRRSFGIANVIRSTGSSAVKLIETFLGGDVGEGCMLLASQQVPSPFSSLPNLSFTPKDPAIDVVAFPNTSLSKLSSSK